MDWLHPAFLLVFGGVAAGPLYDYGYLRALVSTGSFLVVLGMMMTSLCTTYWQVMLAQALVVGLGSGCLFVPSIAILPTYFSTKRALAQGIAASGSSLGSSEHVRCRLPSLLMIEQVALSIQLSSGSFSLE